MSALAVLSLAAPKAIPVDRLLARAERSLPRR
jgi:hypothetical protein